MPYKENSLKLVWKLVLSSLWNLAKKVSVNDKDSAINGSLLIGCAVLNL